jgi:hypothetical protein
MEYPKHLQVNREPHCCVQDAVHVTTKRCRQTLLMMWLCGRCLQVGMSQAYLHHDRYCVFASILCIEQENVVVLCSSYYSIINYTVYPNPRKSIRLTSNHTEKLEFGYHRNYSKGRS